jgi:hypothetical protein
MPTKKRQTQIDRMCAAIIARRLGEISDLPEALTTFVFRIYREFITSYLNLLRQKEGQPQDWFPESLSIDPALIDDMRHFFSDHQHIAKAFLDLNQKMDKLREIDKGKQPNLYQHRVARILNQDIDPC